MQTNIIYRPRLCKPRTEWKQHVHFGAAFIHTRHALQLAAGAAPAASSSCGVASLSCRPLPLKRRANLSKSPSATPRTESLRRGYCSGQIVSQHFLPHAPLQKKDGKSISSIARCIGMRIYVTQAFDLIFFTAANASHFHFHQLKSTTAPPPPSSHNTFVEELLQLKEANTLGSPKNQSALRRSTCSPMKSTNSQCPQMRCPRMCLCSVQMSSALTGCCQQLEASHGNIFSASKKIQRGWRKLKHPMVAKSGCFGLDIGRDFGCAFGL